MIDPMNNKQKVVTILAASALIVLGLFPPMVRGRGGITEFVGHVWIGNGFVDLPAKPGDFGYDAGRRSIRYSAHMALDRLAVEASLVFIAFVAGFFVLADKRDTRSN